MHAPITTQSYLTFSNLSPGITAQACRSEPTPYHDVAAQDALPGVRAGAGPAPARLHAPHRPRVGHQSRPGVGRWPSTERTVRVT